MLTCMRASFIFSLRLALASNDVSCRLQTCAYELNNTAAFVYRQAVGSFLGRRRRTLELLADEAASRVEKAMRAALADGLAWNSLGMSFPSSWNFASNAMPSLVQYYLGVGEANRAMFRADHENCSRFLPDNDMAAGLRRDGHFLVAREGEACGVQTPYPRTCMVHSFQHVLLAHFRAAACAR